jgi:hypothetical protein
MGMKDKHQKGCEALPLRVFSVNPGDSGKKSGYSRMSEESGLEIFGVPGFHSRNTKSQCRTHQPLKPRDIEDLEPTKSNPYIP